MAVWTAIVFVVFVLLNYVSCSCNQVFGSSGGLECVSFDEYHSEYQYATCVSNSFMKERSNGRHHCGTPIIEMPGY